jgi:hypothetical protein
MQCYATLFEPSTEGRKYKKPKIAQPAYTAGVNEIKIAHTTQQMVIKLPNWMKNVFEGTEKKAKITFQVSSLLYDYSNETQPDCDTKSQSRDLELAKRSAQNLKNCFFNFFLTFFRL